MSQNIHPTAYIAENVSLGKNVTIGPFVVIESDVSIGDGCHINAHSVIQQYVNMGSNNVVHPHVVLGGLPQDLGFSGETESYLSIGDNNVFREGFTVHRASLEKGNTLIGSGCYFMNNSHVAHDCEVGNASIFANNVAIGGFVQVGNNVFLGGNVVVHQNCRVGSFVIVRGTSGISKDVIPFTMIGGQPVKHYRLNAVGLRRAGITGERYTVLSDAFRLLRKKQDLDGLQETEELLELKNWLAAKSKRGMHGFFELQHKD